MKTQIITLESHDDLISVRDRLSWSKTPRILLVAPKYVDVTLRQVDLKVLQRHAVSLGAQLGMVTRQRRLRNDAEALGIPVFKSTKDAQLEAWSQPRVRRFERKIPDRTLREKGKQVLVKEAAWRAHPITRIFVFIIGVSAVLSLVALFLPRAQVQLNPIRSTQSIVVPVMAGFSVDSVFITGSIPVHEKRIVVEGEQSVLVTGEGVVAQTKAKGEVVFRNLTQNEVEIPVGTIVRSGDISFATLEGDTVAAGVGETVEVSIEAVEGGGAGNVDSEKINVVEGRLGLSLAVSNPDPTEGGRERSSVQATESDRTRAKNLLLKSLETEARANLLNASESGDLLFNDTIELSQIISENFDLPSGAAGTQLTLNLQAEYLILYADESDLAELATLVLNNSLPPGFIPGSDTVRIFAETEPVLEEDGSIRWSMRVEQEIVQHVKGDQVARLIAGLGTKDAQQTLERNLPLVSSPEIDLSPSWWPWVPIVPFRIEVVNQ